jgi:hypothetical protein
MEKEENKRDGIDGKIARIGEFVEHKPESDIPKEESVPNAPNDEPSFDTSEPSEPSVSPDSAGGVSSDQLKEKLTHIISQIGSKGMTAEDQAVFNSDFEFWNGIIFEIVDMGGNLKSTLDGTRLKLSPAKAMLAYAGATGALILLLRPELVGKIINAGKKKKNPIVQTEEVKKTEPTTSEQPIPEQAPDGDVFDVGIGKG